MKYYLYEIENFTSLCRIDVDSIPIITEKWNEDKQEWVDAPGVIDALGFSSDCFLYKEISAKKANEFLKK